MRFIILLIYCLYINPAIADSVRVRTAIIKSQHLSDKYESAGILKKNNTKDVYSQVSGAVDYIIDPIKANKVDKGAKIFSVDENVASVKNNAAKSLYQEMKSGYESNVKLYKKKMISNDVLEQSKNHFMNAKFQLVQTKKEYDNMVILASEDVIVSPISYRVGDIVQAGEYLFSTTRVGDDKKAEIMIALPSIYLGKIDYKSNIFLLVDDKKIRGDIVRIAKSLNDGSFAVKVTLNSNSDLIHNQIYKVICLYNEHEGLVVPESSIMSSKDGPYIYVVDKKHIVQKVIVKTGVKIGNMSEIISPKIKSGDLVITDGIVKVSPGVKVEIISKEHN